MPDRARLDLYRLDPFSRQLVIAYWRYLLARKVLRLLPFPMRFGFAQALIAFALIAITRDHDMPVVTILWFGALAANVALHAFLRTIRRTA